MPNEIAARLTLPVAVMQPLPPARMLASRNTSLPANTLKPDYRPLRIIRGTGAGNILSLTLAGSLAGEQHVCFGAQTGHAPR